MVSTLRLLGLNSINARNANNNNLACYGPMAFLAAGCLWVAGARGLDHDVANICASQLGKWSLHVTARTFRTQISMRYAHWEDSATLRRQSRLLITLRVCLCSARCAPNVRQALVEYLRKNNAGVIGNFSIVTDKNGNYPKLRGLIHLFLARPEYQNH